MGRWARRGNSTTTPAEVMLNRAAGRAGVPPDAAEIGRWFSQRAGLPVLPPTSRGPPSISSARGWPIGTTSGSPTCFISRPPSRQLPSTRCRPCRRRRAGRSTAPREPGSGARTAPRRRPQSTCRSCIPVGRIGGRAVDQPVRIGRRETAHRIGEPAPAERDLGGSRRRRQNSVRGGRPIDQEWAQMHGARGPVSSLVDRPEMDVVIVAVRQPWARRRRRSRVGHCIREGRG